VGLIFDQVEFRQGGWKNLGSASGEGDCVFVHHAPNRAVFSSLSCFLADWAEALRAVNMQGFHWGWLLSGGEGSAVSLATGFKFDFRRICQAMQ
jgi:hypothetical protein